MVAKLLCRRVPNIQNELNLTYHRLGTSSGTLLNLITLLSSVLLLMSFSACYAEVLESHWGFLVLDRQMTKEFRDSISLGLSETERKARENGQDDATWQTTIVSPSSNGTRTLKGIYISSGETLFHIVRKKLAKSCVLQKANNLTGIDYVSQKYALYTVGNLWSLPVSKETSCAFASYEPKYSINAFLSMIKHELKTNPATGVADIPEGEYHIDTNLVSVSGGYVSLVKSFLLDLKGNAHPSIHEEWHTYQLLPTGLLNKQPLAPSASIDKTWQDFRSVTGKNDSGVRRFDQFAGFNLAPGNNCVTAEVGYVEPPAGSIANMLQAPTTFDLIDGISAKSQKYKNEHPTIIDWSNLDFAAVAPDLSGVAYLKSNLLYWQPTVGQIKQICHITELRGFQWINWHNLSPSTKEFVIPSSRQASSTLTRSAAKVKTSGAPHYQQIQQIQDK